jgi:basic amino acid/polyamine antiporter, APA family
MGNMIGSGVFLLPASLAPFGWNAIAGWSLTIAGALTLAFVLARLTVKLPTVGGPVGFVTAAFGKIPGFLIGWSFWVSIWTANVTIAVAAISYLGIFVPGLLAYSSSATITLIWLITVLNLFGTRTSGGFQVITLIVKLVPLVVVLVLIAIVVVNPAPAHIEPFPKNGLSFTAINAAALLTLWALLGFESASIAADKVSDPASVIPRATVVGTLVTGILYLVVCSGIALLLPPDQISNSSAPFAVFVETYWAREPALLVAAFAAVSAIGALNGWCLMQAELPAAMARRGLLPAWLAQENRHGTPARALIISSLVASLFVLLNSSKSTGDLFAFMAKLSTSATLWLYLACACAALRLNVVRPVAAISLAYAAWTLWGAGLDVSALSFVLMAAGLPLYFWTQKSGATQLAFEP